MVDDLWISVKEKLPRTGIPVLLATNEMAVPLTGFRASRKTDDWWLYNPSGNYALKGIVTHWQPLAAHPTEA